MMTRGKGSKRKGSKGPDVQKCTVDMRGVTLPDRPPKGVRSKGKCYHPKCTVCPKGLHRC